MNNTIDILKKQLDEISELKKLPNESDSKFKVWLKVTRVIIEKKFGEKELKEFKDIYYYPFVLGEISDFENKQSFDEGLNSAEAFINGLIKQVELFGESNTNVDEPENVSKKAVSNKGLHLVINNTQSNQQTINISTTFNQILDIINETGNSEEEKTEAKVKVNELKEEIEKQNPNWEKMKSILHWLLDFSQRVFLKILPFLLEKYNR